MKTFQQGITKQELLGVLKSHQKADNFVKGKYWEYGKGCSVGCALESFTGNTSDHSKFEELFGIPIVIARLNDGIFEGLSEEDSKWWPVAFVEAVPENVDLKYGEKL